MVEERNLQSGDLMAALVQWMRIERGGGTIPRKRDEINPYAHAPPKSQELIELEQWQAQRAWRVRAGWKEPEPCL